MRALAASLVGLLLVVAPASGQTPEGQTPEGQTPEQQREREHLVRTGDTLWDLAQHYFANPFRWRLIHEANTHSVADPHWIYPEQVLIIPGIRSVTAASVITRPVAAVPARTTFYREPPARNGDGPTILLDPVRERMPVLPGEFYAAAFLQNPMHLDPVGRVIRTVRERQELRGLARSAHPTDDLFIGSLSAERPQVGDRMIVVAVGRRVPEAGRRFRVIEPRAVLRVEEVDRDVARARVEQQFGRVSADDLVLRYHLFPDFLAEQASPVNGGFDLEGRVIQFVDDQALYGRLAKAFINLGSVHGVGVGDVFEAILPERRARHRRSDLYRGFTERVPEESIALLRVVRVDESSSTVIVDELTAPALDDGIAVRRVRKMP